MLLSRDEIQWYHPCHLSSTARWQFACTSDHYESHGWNSILASRQPFRLVYRGSSQVRRWDGSRRLPLLAYIRSFAGTYRLCFKNEQYFTAKIIYIGVLAVHTDLLPEANIVAVEEKKNNDSAVIDDFTARAMVQWLIALSRLKREMRNWFWMSFMNLENIRRHVEHTLSGHCVSNHCPCSPSSWCQFGRNERQLRTKLGDLSNNHDDRLFDGASVQYSTSVHLIDIDEALVNEELQLSSSGSFRFQFLSCDHVSTELITRRWTGVSFDQSSDWVLLLFRDCCCFCTSYHRKIARLHCAYLLFTISLSLSLGIETAFSLLYLVDTLDTIIRLAANATRRLSNSRARDEG